MRRILVAGVGNVLRGDDGFGIRLLHKLESGKLGRNPAIRFWESGIAGVSLVQELLDGFDALVVLDAIDNRGRPGELFVFEPDLDALRSEGGNPSRAVDLHEATPRDVLRMAAALDVLPERVWIVGAQPGSCDELTERLTPEVARAVEDACRRVEELIAGFVAQDVSQIDEVLQILYWLRGEGLAPDVAPSDLERWLGLGAVAIAPVLERMVGLGLVEAARAGRYRLSALGFDEGARRFADEFSEITKPGHGECGDPSCECYESGDPADCRHNVM
ncbi:MAG TPA: hydrogenase maturation protease [Vicinamibacteria bacterium]|nr:hydrogenase maturation protease [Vicinamibacteria bacterium]